jgi:hypothetical protein
MSTKVLLLAREIISKAYVFIFRPALIAGARSHNKGIASEMPDWVNAD